MFRKPFSQDPGADELLGRAMRALTEPEVPPGFNDRIHRELSLEPSEKRSYQQVLRPAIFSLGGSFAVSLILLVAFTGPMRPAPTTDITMVSVAGATHAGAIDNTESIIERTDLTSASIRTLLVPAASHTSASHTLDEAPLIRVPPTTHRRQGA